ncbi:MAG: ribonucleoside-diphosphate reductase alpha chain [Rhodothermales bacterium]|jgi:ribonucleoside-diphosphate reductase alpha chain
MIKPNTEVQLNLAGIDPLQNKEFRVRKRDGRRALFQDARIRRAIEKAFRADSELSDDDLLSDELRRASNGMSDKVVNSQISRALRGQELDVETIQDDVEKELMSAGHYGTARRFILYREERRKQRELREPHGDEPKEPVLHVQLLGGERVPLDAERIRTQIAVACRGVEDSCSAQDIADEVLRMLYDGITPDEISKAMVMAAKSNIEREPAYAYVSARLLLKDIYSEVLGSYRQEDLESLHRNRFVDYLQKGIDNDRLAPTLMDYDLEKISGALRIERDQRFQLHGVQTLYDRYLIHVSDKRIETPQYFWMRVCMGLAQSEENKEERAIEFYDVMSTFLFVSSTPTLFNSGTLHQQLSSCYLTTIDDDLEHIFKCVSDDARLSKWAGGLGNDWTSVRATGGHIKGTNGRSQGVIPFLKVANDTAVAVNQGGKRKGAMCAYLETWHLDIEDFLELRRNVGDERRRTPDMNTANWIPDLFMKRVAEDGFWTLLNPCEAPDLHDLYGKAFDARYEEYEAMAERGELEQHKRIKAVDLWRKMLSMLFETGHPWITFKDPSNIRSPQDHKGVVHSSNLCTEILLNTSAEETAVCNLGSVNMVRHMSGGKINEGLLAKTVRTAVRMLDNVIDINYYPTPEAKVANSRHRPIGMGIMGFQDALYLADISYASQEAVVFADHFMERISYNAILASTALAAERGTYESYPGSKWERGLLPIDTVKLLAEERGGYMEMDESVSLDWEPVREAVRTYGMRNCNTMAIAPTATISNIVGVTQSIEPTYKNLFVKSNLSGEFTVINSYMVNDLKDLGMWDADMVEDLKYYDGSVAEIGRIPEAIRRKYITSFQLEAAWLIECGSRRQKWIDMGQSLNLYLSEPNGRKLSEMYQFAWRRGLKTTYYLRSLAATQIEKSTVDINKHGVQPRWMKSKSASASIQVNRMEPESAKMCSILDPECDACQ